MTGVTTEYPGCTPECLVTTTRKSTCPHQLRLTYIDRICHVNSTRLFFSCAYIRTHISAHVAVSKMIMDNSKVWPQEDVVKIVHSRYFTAAARSARRGKDEGHIEGDASGTMSSGETEKERLERGGGQGAGDRQLPEFNIVYRARRRGTYT